LDLLVDELSWMIPWKILKEWKIQFLKIIHSTKSKNIARGTFNIAAFESHWRFISFIGSG